MQSQINPSIVRNFINFPNLRPITIGEKGRIDINPAIKHLREIYPEKFDRVVYRYQIRLLFKRIRFLIMNHMCYTLNFFEDAFHLQIRLKKKKARKIGIKLSYVGKTIREIYEKLSQDLSGLIYKINTAMAISMALTTE